MGPHVIVSCEHAGWAVPPGVDLGLSAAQRSSHIGWDPGAAQLADALGASLGLPVFRGVWSRLVVDLNRRESDPGVIAQESGGVTIPGNVGLDAASREARLARWHRPWRRALIRAVDEAVAAGGCIHISVHSFDPSFHPGGGPGVDPARVGLDLGLLFDPSRVVEKSLAEELVVRLRAAGCAAHPNRPYAGTAEGMVTWLRERHCALYAGLELELRQGPTDFSVAQDVVQKVILAAAGNPLWAPATGYQPAG